MNFVNTRIENAVVVGKAIKNCKKTIKDCRKMNLSHFRHDGTVPKVGHPALVHLQAI
jgi:hypothetical protein